MEPARSSQVTTAFRVKVLWLALVASRGARVGLDYLQTVGLDPESLDDETAPILCSTWHRALLEFSRRQGTLGVRTASTFTHPACLAAWARVLRGAQGPAQAFAQIAEHGGDVPTERWATETLTRSRWEGSVLIQQPPPDLAELCRAAREAELGSLPLLFGLRRGHVRSEQTATRHHFVVTWTEPHLTPVGALGAASAVALIFARHTLLGTHVSTAEWLGALGAGTAIGMLGGVMAQRRRLTRSQSLRLSALERAARLSDRLRSSPAELETGRIVASQYRLGRRLGGGASSSIWDATRIVDATPVVVKLLKASARHDSRAADRLRLEARALGRIAHPNVVRLLDSGDLADGNTYLVLERLQGETLQALLERTACLPTGALRAVALGLCDALQAVHAAGVIHRDLKPGNVHVSWTPDGSPQVSLFDFGVAKVAWDDADLTEPGVALGTPGYMAPEQRVGTLVDVRTDLFALGCLLFECVTGQPFALPGSATETPRAEDYAASRLKQVRIPKDWACVLGRLLAHHADNRFQSVADVRAELVSLNLDA